MHSPVALIPQLAGHIIAAGGKRLRPMLTLAAARLCGYRGDRHIALAACVEFIHTATLLHDDVVDESDLRRGRATANAVWGNKASVLVGDFLFSRAFQLMVEDGSLRVLEILSRASAVIAEGEVLQLVTSNDTETTEQAYLEVIRCKTAALFAAACRIGAVVAEPAEGGGGGARELRPQSRHRLPADRRRARLLGQAGGARQDRRRRFPRRQDHAAVILAFRRGDETERAFWRRTLEDLEQRDDDLERAIGLLDRHGALRDTIARARHYGAIARDALGIFPDGPEKRAFLEVVDFSIERAH